MQSPQGVNLVSLHPVLRVNGRQRGDAGRVAMGQLRPSRLAGPHYVRPHKDTAAPFNDHGIHFIKAGSTGSITSEEV